MWCERKSEIQHDGLKRGNTNSSSCIRHSCKIPETKNMYIKVKKFRWAVSHIVQPKRISAIQNGGLQTENTYISVCIQYSCSIPTAIPMFSRSRNLTKLYFIMCDACFVEFLDLENMGVAVGIFFLYIIGAEIRWGGGVILPPLPVGRTKL